MLPPTPELLPVPSWFDVTRSTSLSWKLSLNVTVCLLASCLSPHPNVSPLEAEVVHLLPAQGRPLAAKALTGTCCKFGRHAEDQESQAPCREKLRVHSSFPSITANPSTDEDQRLRESGQSAITAGGSSAGADRGGEEDYTWRTAASGPIWMARGGPRGPPPASPAVGCHRAGLRSSARIPGDERTGLRSGAFSGARAARTPSPQTLPWVPLHPPTPGAQPGWGCPWVARGAGLRALAPAAPGPGEDT